ncbi:MAG: metal-dependent transcriptional regulator [Bacteroidetes bacterium]|nr:metal-dependent transcriptional regulator [Bacteroidota bacterium]MDA1122253.1 metal-dependent transcriptional regulator [Bacteroidota bacterium]
MTPDPGIALIVFFILVFVGVLLWKIIKSPFLLQNIKQSKKALVEDILKQLYHVEYSGRTASLNAMAGALKLSDRKIVRLVEDMSSHDLLKLDQDILQLTSSGRDYALKIIRVHRLWEKYLSERTGFDKSEWHDRAEQKEHTLTEEQAEQLYHDLGNPRFDPHGDPIPTEAGEIIETHWKSLSSLSENTVARIVHLEDEPEVIYQQIVAEKLHIGSQVKIIASDNHEVKFFSEGEEYRFSPIVASNISVKELTAQEKYEEDVVRLSSLDPGEKAIILGISSECRGASRRRLLDLGFIAGSSIETEFASPSKEPKAYSIRNTIIALRGDQADLILIKKVNE